MHINYDDILIHEYVTKERILGIKVFHIPTRKQAFCSSKRSQWQNRLQAMKELEMLLKEPQQLELEF